MGKKEEEANFRARKKKTMFINLTQTHFNAKF